MSKEITVTPAKFFGFKTIYESHLSQLMDDNYQEQIQHQLFREKFVKELNKFDKEKQLAFLEYLSNVLSFCVKQKYTPLKFSALLEISAYIFAQSFSQNYSHSDSYKLLEKELVRHSLDRPPVNIFIFAKEDLANITQFFLDNLFRHYAAYKHLLSENIDIELNAMYFKTVQEPKLSDFNEIEIIDEQKIKILREYLVDKETGLTQSELEEIMKGESIHQVPKSKREEWIKLKKQREVEEKIQKAMNKELEKLNAMMEEEMKKQDQEFLAQLQVLKDPKKKK